MRRFTRATYLGVFLALILCVGIFVAAPVFAQDVNLESFAETAGFSTTASITVIIARLIRTAITLVGVVTVVFILYGGFVYMTAGGSPERIAKAKKIIINSVIGLILVFSSFAIAQFILNALVGATSGDISGSSSSSGSYTDGSGSSTFYLSSVNTECAEALQNLQLQFVFSKKIDGDTVEEGILIRDAGGDAVEGTFIVSSRTVTFTPSQACDSPYEDESCFDPLSSYTIDLDSTVIDSSAGSSLTCSSSYPCSFSFTTGSEVDIADPTVEIDAPENGESFYAGSIELLQALTSDDSGVSTVDFYVIDDEEAIYSSGVDYSNAGELLGGNVENAFFSDTAEEWDTEGYTTNETYNIWAKGYDCAGNSDTASRVSIVLRAANCNNEVLDEDLGETEVDCGGDSSSAYYCGSCDGDSCSEDSDCASGQCVDGQCVTIPKIESVSAGDGAEGNLITISGEGFGDEEGVLYFLGTENSDETSASAYECNSEIQWSDSEIIVQVPSGAIDGPISVVTSDDETERTDDDYGPSISDFDVNAIARPGICLLDPDSDTYGSTIEVYGNSFGDSQGSSTFYFTNYEASTYVSWSDTLLNLSVPNVNSGRYSGQVFTGDYLCVDTDNVATGDTCTDDEDCDTDAGESCAASWCSETLEYCGDDDDCGDDGGSCESVRVGSNKVTFTVADSSSSSSPIISFIDSGWQACSDDNTHCGSDDDCSEGATCDDADNWGPAGQYITIYGTGFGTSTGSVFFDNESLGYTALGDTDFPDVCGEDFWHDTSITMKVPETYLTEDEDAIEAITHALTVERADGNTSGAEDFVVLDEVPGPSICNIDPSAGPAESEITLYGENLGSDDGTVVFYSTQETTFGVWANDEISSVIVPDEAATGPVYIEESESGYSSNSVTFSVGDCREDADLCSEGESCCSNGSCSETCDETEEVSAHYAFKITTGITPNTPRVILACDEDGTSPSPWDGWSDPDDICLNASVQAEFNMAMNGDTLTTSTVIVRSCSSEFTLEEETAEDRYCSFSGDACDDVGDCEDEDESCVLASEGECKTWEVVEGTMPTPDETGFSWQPTSGLFEAGTHYQVSLQGGDQIQSADGGYLAEDFDWEFTTSSSTELCEVGDVNVRPGEYTQTEQAYVDYTAQLTAQNDSCVALSCAGYTLYWDSVSDDVLIPTSEWSGVCVNEVYAQSETTSDDPAIITATVTDAEGDPSGEGELTINFLDPEIEDYFPQCTTACVNALPWAEFNTKMDGGTIGAGAVTLYECDNSLCETSELTEFAEVASVSFSGDTCETEEDSTQKFYINFNDGETLEPNTWYRVVVDATEIYSCTGVALSDSGSNYGTDDNRYFEDAFSWVFRTKNDAVSCAVDSLTLDPSVATLYYVGDRAEFDAFALGAPDDCSDQGQTLQSGSYLWDAWVSTDAQNQNGVSTSTTDSDEVVSYMISNGAIELTSDIASYCTAACLNAGAPVTIADGVCGNGSVEDSEECDDGGTEAGDGCSAVCLNEGSVQCDATCSSSGAECTNDASCNETCASAMCTSASDVGNACVGDEGCESRSCSEAGLCEDFEDADTSCSNDGVCDSGSCVGACSLSGGVCSGASSECVYYSGDSCERSGSGCCGNGVRDWSASAGGEDCDDGNITSGDGCSSSCKNEGARSIGSVCGDGTQDWVVNTGGEDCDDGNTSSGDGCSRNCLLEGSASEDDVYAICGDGTIDEGEDCDPGDYSAEDDGCSSECLYEGSSVCPTSDSANCCGNGDVDTGEACDGDEGCSSSCLWLGSSYEYATPSFCGDGIVGTAEDCDALSTASFSAGDYGVAQVATGAPTEVNEDTGYAISTISVVVDEDVEGEATLRLQCACTTDNSCGAAGLGCGESNCCYERPTIGELSPADNSVAFLAGTDEGFCRNSAVWIEFSESMDETTFGTSEDLDGDGTIQEDEFDSNLYIDLVSVDSDGDGAQETVSDIADCPSGYIGSLGSESVSFGGKIWHFIKSVVLGLFGREVQASSTFSCYVPVTSYSIVQNGDGTSRVYLRFSELLQENAIYKLVVVGDETPTDSEKTGVLSQNDVTLCIDDDCEDEYFSQKFAIGEEICDLDRVLLEDTGDVDAEEYESLSIQYFSTTGEEHAFVATPQTYRAGGYQEISPIEGLYDWDWSWASSITDSASTNVITPETEEPEDTTRSFTASGNDGSEIVLAIATITDDELFDPSTAEIEDDETTDADESSPARTVSGTLEVRALLCENPWPSLASETLSFPYVEDVLPSYFSFYYCRDAGEDGTEDDLPALGDPIDVTSFDSSVIRQEIIFKVEGSSDAIGVRVLPNASYLSPADWVEEQQFTGAFTQTELDSYSAVESGNTLYAAAANLIESSGDIYPNMYVVSYNDNASAESEEIFSQLLTNWRFNANNLEVTNINLCQDESDGTYALNEDEEYVSCEWDGDCYEEFEEETIVCDGQKAKLTRDMQRLIDVTALASSLDSYGEENGHCAVTQGQSCDADEDCPGTEVCVVGFPDVQSGTFIPAISNSIWSSWNASLANELGTTLPTDPINEFFNCSEDGYDSASCWNGESGTFMCPENSHVYGYQSVGGEAYKLYATLELSGEYEWTEDIDADSTDEGTITVEYPTGNAPSSVMSGFSLTPVFCDGSTWGDSALCGDGTQGALEGCEIGDTMTIACTASGGVIAVSCLSDCSDFQDQTEAEFAGAECIPYDCGNGVVETGEDCDDGSLNGTYGHCGDTCTATGSFSCGDGYLAGSEQCDCGTTSTYASVILESSSWATIGPDATGTTASPWCATSNGQYDAGGDNCAYNCTLPGLSCGDGIVNGSESCDGDYESWEGKLCSDGVTTCTTTSDCDGTDTCGGTGYEAAGSGTICIGGDDAGDTCDSTDTNEDCEDNGGACSTNTYDLYRYRTCSSSCEWPTTWTGPVGGDQTCGNGTVEGDEACDDGNSSNNDSCLNTCEENVCGDDYVYVGVESCDDGEVDSHGGNGVLCEADYGSTCNYCNTICQYKTTSGAYCGDGVVNGSEVCDGTYSTAFKNYDSTSGSITGSCASEEYDTTDSDGYTCRWLGVCNGGTENGEYCTLNYTTYASSGTVSELTSGNDVNSCSGGDCVAPICADNCGSSCPTSYETTGLFVVSESLGATPGESIRLYSYLNDEGDSPDNAALYIPACSVATSITADINDEDVEHPDVDIVFVTDLSGSMDWDVDTNQYCNGGTNDGDACTSSSSCDGSTCEASGAPVGIRRIDYVVEATRDAVSDLFDAYGSLDATMQISLVSFSGSTGLCSGGSDDGNVCQYNADCEDEDCSVDDGAEIDIGLSLYSSESSMMSILDDYADSVVNGTPTYNGLSEAISILSASTAEVKIVVLLSDGDPGLNSTFNVGSSTGCSGYAWSNYPSTSYYADVPACVAEISDVLIDGSTEGVPRSDILIYSAAVTTDSDLKGYMAHMSSNECAWSSVTSTGDCEGDYAFSASSSDEIAEMYAAIVDSILGTRVTFTTTDDDGTYTTTSEVQSGSNVELPFPTAFACQSTEQVIPLRNAFYGTGTMEFSDFNITYCPYE
ncbi:Ig-like domain-containing protein [Candidatus Uhrbacteria bacterium]|nr:Ig-like domain-containing protein [Candidatus Uhrbacteria bacterium]